jgi:putative flippase GtrA
MLKRRPDAALLGRYAISGVANTVVGLSVIYALMWFNCSPYLANFIGYAAGLSFAYFNSRSYVFRFSGEHRSGVVRYLAAFAVCYSINMAVLVVGIESLGWHQWLAQGTGVVTHAALMFLLSRHLVFVERSAD